MERSIRWLDRCIKQHERSGRQDRQNLFAIVQGGLHPTLREKCLDAMVERKDHVAGFAIGGLSGGEEKGMFCGHSGYNFRLDCVQMCSGGCKEHPRDYLCNLLTTRSIKQCTDRLPFDRKPPSHAAQHKVSCCQSGPRYSMGIGFAEGQYRITLPIQSHLIVRYHRSSGLCSARRGHGTFYQRSHPGSTDDLPQADCVFPTRTARFGVALTFKGPLNLRTCMVPLSDKVLILDQG